ncbi:hypothetical protein JKF63_06063 [Porcisia hertigi]|uniref:Uncharacterized protein n=1 Tax=Porcisia hertigi TaxID=2761500 RepID=A0A836INX1_9TRYP|nr:hypothetical protein JKF63_06063 [Porcisia hertigi]
MLEKVGLPFRKSLHSVLDVGNGLTDVRMFFSIEVEGVSGSITESHSTVLQVPAIPTLNSIELSSVLFKAAGRSLLRRVYLFIQRLDFDGRMIGPPVPLAANDTAQSSVSLNLRLFSGDRVRLLLLQDGTGPGITEVILSGCILNNPDSFFVSSTHTDALLSWKPEPFRSVCEQTVSESRMRSLSPQPTTEPKGCASDDEAPTLLYAPVYGGDDES